jgi:hypothetical protein
MGLSLPLGLLHAALLVEERGLAVAIALSGALLFAEPRRRRPLAAPLVAGALVAGLSLPSPLLGAWGLTSGLLWLRAARSVNQSPLRGGPPV